MVVITPLMLAGGQFGMSMIQGFMGNQAKQQEYTNQRAQQRASAEFARWTASNQARTADLNSSYSFYQEQVNHGQDLAYASQMRQYELAKSINQAEVVGRTRSSAMADYSQQSGAIADAFQQQSMADAVSMMQYKQQALRAQASVSATMQEGRSVDRYINDYARQVGDMETMRQMNDRFRTRQYTKEQAAQIATYLNRYNSQQLYQQQNVTDPIAPFAPLATLINPAGPSFTGAGPSAGTAFLGSALNATQAALGTYGAAKSWTNSGGKD